MKEEYIKKKFDDIIKYENIIEKRKYAEDINIDQLIKDNNYNLKMCKKYNNKYILIEDKYNTYLNKIELI